ncbi:hypothetical protein BDC45DRAFT_178982 [Circinella umbellata]|nr:hypothetical protein BDC45DRAFT_178982 [Circinella umbellata]
MLCAASKLGRMYLVGIYPWNLNLVDVATFSLLEDGHDVIYAWNHIRFMFPTVMNMFGWDMPLESLPWLVHRSSDSFGSRITRLLLFETDVFKISLPQHEQVCFYQWKTKTILFTTYSYWFYTDLNEQFLALVMVRVSANNLLSYYFFSYVL